jgi:putative nucleotidyltransferase with HDIG domain
MRLSKPIPATNPEPAVPARTRLPLGEVLERAGIPAAQAVRLEAFLEPLRAHHPKTYDHAVRVGDCAHRIGVFMGVDDRALLFAGLLHDIGKTKVRTELLDRTDTWSAEDALEMERHVLDGFEMLTGHFDFSAQIALWHHQFQPNAYPSVLPAPLHPLAKGTEVTVATYGRILALADGYDALHRVNFQDGAVRTRTPQEIQELMLARNPDQRVLIQRLYGAGLLT